MFTLEALINDNGINVNCSMRIALMAEAKDTDNGLWIEVAKSDNDGRLSYEFTKNSNFLEYECQQSIAFYLTARDDENKRQKVVTLHLFNDIVDIDCDSSNTGYLTEVTVNSDSLQSKKIHRWISRTLAGIPRQHEMQLLFQFHPNDQQEKDTLVRHTIGEFLSVYWRDISDESMSYNVKSAEIGFDDVMVAILLKRHTIQIFAMSNNLWAITKRREYDWQSAVLNSPSSEIFSQADDEFFVGCRTQGSLKVFCRIKAISTGYSLDVLEGLTGTMAVTQMHQKADSKELEEFCLYEPCSLSRRELEFVGANSHCLVKLMVQPKSTQNYPPASLSLNRSIRWSQYNSELSELLKEAGTAAD